MIEHGVAHRETPSRPAATRALVERLKEAGQDHEFYPTTDSIIQAVVRDIGEQWTNESGNRYKGHDFESLMDIGAGAGKVLTSLREKCGFKALYAIEKSMILCQQLDPDILIVGTEFEEQSLFSKGVDVIFCNPPYSVFEAWCEKIIRQAACTRAYLVIPERWEQSMVLEDAVKWRGVTTRKLGNFTFADAEREARAKVHIVRVDFPNEDSAFAKFFEQEFSGFYRQPDAKEGQDGEKEEKSVRFEQLVPGPSYPEALVGLYNAEMEKVQRNYRLVSELDHALLKEFDMSPTRIMGCLLQRLDGLRNVYWQELFNHMDKITNRLTSKTRKKMLETLQKHTQVDFTHNNILAVVIWAINNANRYLESQLLDTYDVMVDKANVRLYKSNKKVWADDDWRYSRAERLKMYSHYALDYRIVTHRIGGVSPRWGWSTPEISENAADFIGDLLTIANNLGFQTDDSERTAWLPYASRNKWTPGELVVFHQVNGEPIMDVRGYKNGNLHMRLNQDFMRALNVEHGRLRGWLRTPQEAVEELQDPKAAQYFSRNHRIEINPVALLT